LLKVIMGIIPVSKGKILYKGQDITNLNISERANLGISLAFQQPVKFKGISINDIFEISAGENVEKQKKCKALNALGLCPNEYLYRELDSNLSGGELKRLEIASVIFGKSKCLMFDEPEAGIDLWSFSKLVNVFEFLHIKNGAQIIVVSHQEKLLKVAQKVYVLDKGKIVKQGNFDDVI